MKSVIRAEHIATCWDLNTYFKPAMVGSRPAPSWLSVCLGLPNQRILEEVFAGRERCLHDTHDRREKTLFFWVVDLVVFLSSFTVWEKDGKPVDTYTGTSTSAYPALIKIALTQSGLRIHFHEFPRRALNTHELTGPFQQQNGFFSFASHEMTQTHQWLRG